MVPCSRCKKMFPKKMLQSDLRLPGSQKRAFCDTCLLEELEDQTAVCPECHILHVYPDFYNPPRWTERICPACRIKDTKHEQFIIDKHLYYARKKGYPATLTLEEWYRAIYYFELRCAYCQIKPYQMLEHFVPLSGGGEGTTASNCVPSCFACNNLKMNRTPEQVLQHPKFPQGAVERVGAYLRQFL